MVVGGGGGIGGDSKEGVGGVYWEGLGQGWNAEFVPDPQAQEIYIPRKGRGYPIV